MCNGDPHATGEGANEYFAVIELCRDHQNPDPPGEKFTEDAHHGTHPSGSAGRCEGIISIWAVIVEGGQGCRGVVGISRHGALLSAE